MTPYFFPNCFAGCRLFVQRIAELVVGVHLYNCDSVVSGTCLYQLSNGTESVVQVEVFVRRGLAVILGNDLTIGIEIGLFHRHIIAACSVNLK